MKSKREEGRRFGSKKKALLLALPILFFLMVVGISGQGEKKEEIVRNQPGQGEKQEALEASIGKEKYELDVQVNERAYSEKEAKKEIKAAKKEIDESFPGENDSLERVTKPVVMESSYREEQVEAEWRLEPYGILNSQGEFQEKELPEKGRVLEARVLLSCGGVQEEYCFSFHVFSPELSMKEELEAALKKAERASADEEVLILPKKVGGRSVVWREQPSHMFLKAGVFVVIIIILLKLRKLEEEREKKKERELELLMYYPQIVNTLSLLMGAGMSVSRAWERMVKRYLEGKGGRKNAACEEMCITWNEIRDGMGERRAYERFGNRCDLPQYKKLSSLLTQNLRKGTAGMTELLVKESQLALEQRKNLAKKLGEEAGTKLLMPMMIMLVIVMVIVMLPALLTF